MVTPTLLLPVCPGDPYEKLVVLFPQLPEYQLSGKAALFGSTVSTEGLGTMLLAWVGGVTGGVVTAAVVNDASSIVRLPTALIRWKIVTALVLAGVVKLAVYCCQLVA